MHFFWFQHMLGIFKGRRGVAVFITACGAKGRGFEPPSIFFFFEFFEYSNISKKVRFQKKIRILLWPTTHADKKEPLEPLGSIRLTLDARVR